MPNVPFPVSIATLLPYNRARCPVSNPTWCTFRPKACKVSRFQPHLVHFPAKSVQGVPFPTPPGTLLGPKRARCPIPDPTWYTFRPKPCKVSRFQPHLVHFQAQSVQGVPFPTPPGTLSGQKRSRCPISNPTWYAFRPKPCKVSHFQPHLVRFPPQTVQGVPFPVSIVTLLPYNRARCPVSNPTWCTFRPKACKVSRFQPHLVQKKRIPCGILFKVHI